MITGVEAKITSPYKEYYFSAEKFETEKLEYLDLLQAYRLW
jgi:hypothetical protein